MARPQPKDNQIKIDLDRFIVSKTDSKGMITYINEYFIEVSQYSKDELVGSSHNIIRHPDMPKAMFKILWQNIKQKKDFSLVMKNLTKDGSYYWVVAKIESLSDPLTGQILTHTAHRKAALEHTIDTIEPIYKKMIEIEDINGMEASEKFFLDFLKENNMTYGQFIDDIIKEKDHNKMKSVVGSIKSMFGR